MAERGIGTSELVAFVVEGFFCLFYCSLGERASLILDETIATSVGEFLNELRVASF